MCRVLLVAVAVVAALVADPFASATSQAAERAPSISAPGAILVEANTGRVLFKRAASKPRGIASTTKLMTALLTVENAKRGDVVASSDYVAANNESRIGSRPGEPFTVADLLRGLMIESANDAAVTLAEHVGGTRAKFVAMMNERARELGLKNTRFANPIGLDAPDNYSTPRDLARLAAVLRRDKFIRRLADRTAVKLSSGWRKRGLIRNRNTLLLRDKAVNGLKTGYTRSSGYSLVATRTVDEITLVAVVLGAPSMATRNSDVLALLRWGESKLKWFAPVDAKTVVGKAEIRYQRGATVNLVTKGKVRRILPAATEITVRDVGVPTEVTGPLSRDQAVAYREVLADGKPIERVAIVTQAYVPVAALPERTRDWFTRPVPLIGLGLLVGLTLVVGRRLRHLRRRPPQRRPPSSIPQEPEAATR